MYVRAKSGRTASEYLKLHGDGIRGTYNDPQFIWNLLENSTSIFYFKQYEKGSQFRKLSSNEISLICEDIFSSTRVE